MALTQTTLTAMLTAASADWDYASIHSAEPNSSGSNEITADAAYARKAVTWGSASAGAIASSGSMVFDITSGTTTSHCGIWSASSSGTFYGYGSLSTGSTTFGNNGTVTVSALTVTLT